MTFALAARSPNSLEPAFFVQGADNWVNMQIFDTLVRPEDGTFAVTPGDFKPSLAESWTSSADGRTWTFQLRKGVKFHGGYGGVTADDVKFTFRSLGDFASASSDFSTLRAIPAIVSASARDEKLHGICPRRRDRPRSGNGARPEGTASFASGLLPRFLPAGLSTGRAFT